MSKTEIEKLLKLKLNPREFDIDGKQYTGWSANLDDYFKYEDNLLSIWRKLHAENIRAFAGNSVMVDEYNYATPLFIVPELPTVNIVSFVKTGTHNNSSDNWKVVQKALTKVFKESEYEIQFADAAGLHATFLAMPSEVSAKKINDIILDINPEAFDVMDEMTAVDYIQKTCRFKLWWD